MKVTPESLKPESKSVLMRSSNPNRLAKLMIDDFRQDPVLAVRWILGWELPPHQRMRLRAFWRKQFFLDDSGISTGKDATAAMCAAMRCILFPGWVSAFLAKRIGQLQNIRKEYFEKWMDECPYFANEVESITVPHGVITVKFRNKSVIKLLAAGWERNAESLRSERWNECYMNEWHTYGALKEIKKTVFGRVTRSYPGKFTHPYEDICDNHIVLMASAGYKWQPEYSLVESWQSKIDDKNPWYGRHRWNYYDIPKKTRAIFTSEKVMKEMFESLAIEDLLVEVIGVWMHSASDYYDSMKVNDCRVNGIDVEFARAKEPGWYYIMGVDIAKNRDDFSVTILKSTLKSPVRPVYNYRGFRMKTWQMSGIIHKLRIDFHVNFILMDAGGGGLYIKEELEKDVQIMPDGKKMKVNPILTQRDFKFIGGQPILELYKWAKEYTRLYKYFITNHTGVYHDDGILDTSHSMLKNAIERKEIEFPISNQYELTEEDVRIINKHGMSSTEAMKQKRIISENIDNMLSELIGVKRKMNPDGTFYITSKGFYSWLSVKKKDSAYSLLYAYVGYKILMAEIHSDEGDDGDDIFASDDMHGPEDPYFNQSEYDDVFFGDYE